MSSAVEQPAVVGAPVDPDFKDGDLYEVFCPEGSSPWHVIFSMEEDDGRSMYWAVIQMLQSKTCDVDFEWAVFMKTGRCGSSGLRHFSKKFTDGSAAIKTFAEWFLDKTGNKWHADFNATVANFTPQPGKYRLLTPEEGQKVLASKGARERPRPKLGHTNIPVDIYFKDRNQYQVYITPDQDLWTAVLSINEGGRHTQYAIIQVLVARPDVKVEFDFVVFMRQGKVGGSAQRYAKRYTVEAAALATFHQWFKEKTGNEWYGSFKDSLEEFSPQFGKFELLQESQWSEVIEFEERSNAALVDTSIEVDANYRDRDLYRVYHTENDELWAAVLSDRNSEGVFRSFVVLQLLAKRPNATVDFDYVVFRRVGERGESGQWTAKKFTNELDALRTFKMWYQDEAGLQWKGSFAKSFEEFKPQPNKLALLPIEFWESTATDAALVMASTTGASSLSLSMILNNTEPGRTESAPVRSGMSIDMLKQALQDSTVMQQLGEGPGDKTQQLVVQRPASRSKATLPPWTDPAVEVAPRDITPTEAPGPTEAPTPPKVSPKQPAKRKSEKASAEKNAPVAADDAVVDPLFELAAKYTKVHQSVQLQSQADKRSRFYVMQVLESTDAETPKSQRYCVFIRTGRVGTDGGTNYRTMASLDTAKRAFDKKFKEKTDNDWLGSTSATAASFGPKPGMFELRLGLT